MRAGLLLTVFLAIGCAVPRPPKGPSPTPEVPPVAADPCEGMVAFDVIATDTEAALQAHSKNRYVELATGLREAAACEDSVEVQSRRGRLLAAMGDDLLADDPEAARALFHEGFEVLAEVAEGLDDPAEAAEAARLQYDLLDRALYYEPHQPQAPTRQSCKVTSTGECPYRDPTERTYPYSEDDRDELRAHDVYSRFGDDPERLRDVRYMRFRLLAEHRELGSELAALEAFIEEHDGHPLAAWAAFLLIDELAKRMTESEQRSVAELEAMVHWIERLETMALWKLEGAEDLQSLVPTLHAGAMWQLGIEARERGRYAECADRFLAISNRFVDHDRAAEVLAIAAECLDADSRVDEANDVRRQLKKRFPHSDHAKKSP